MRHISSFYVLSLLGMLTIFIVGRCKTYEKVSTPDPVTTMTTNDSVKGHKIELIFKKGPKHNHPLMAVWVEDTSGNFLQNLYVAESIGKGIFQHGDASTGKWMPGPILRPAALPVWTHKRGVKSETGLYVPSEKHPVADAVTGATPAGDFILTSHLLPEIPERVMIYFEVNQTWDFNEYWTNNKFPDNDEYKTSCQPALVYAAQVDLNKKDEYTLKLIGHSHYAGENGKIYPDVGTFTTALQIVKEIKVVMK